MSDTTEIEKKSLEAHVELCAERYRQLECTISDIKGDVSELKSILNVVRDKLSEMTDKRNTQLISWGLGVMSVMLGTIGYLVVNYVL
jgi:hypothetical protein